MIFNIHQQYILSTLFFGYATLQASQPSQETMENLKRIIHEVSVYKDQRQSSFIAVDYIKISVELSEAMKSAGCKESCWMTCLGATYVCVAHCNPLFAAKMRCEVTMSIAQNYLKKYHREVVNPFVFRPTVHVPSPAENSNYNNQNNEYGYFYNPHEDDGML